MSESPRLSVVMPVWGADPEYLREAIKSVTDQTFGDFELIVVEDESPRSATDVLAKIGDPRVRHCKNPRKNGLGAALNFGIAQARASLIARMDADDVCEPDRFAKQVAAFDSDPALDLLGSQISIIDHLGSQVGARVYPVEHAQIVRTLRRYNCISHPTVVFKRTKVRELGGYGEGIVHEDYDLWCRLAQVGARMANHPERLLRYRYHSESAKLADIRKMLVETIRVKERNFAGQLDSLDHLRIWGEWGLTLIPGAWVVRLFAALEYNTFRRKADQSRS